MSPPRQSEGKSKHSLWPLIAAGAAAGAMWWGLDPEAAKAAAGELMRLLGSLVRPWLEAACANLKQL